MSEIEALEISGFVPVSNPGSAVTSEQRTASIPIDKITGAIRLSQVGTISWVGDGTSGRRIASGLSVPIKHWQAAAPSIPREGFKSDAMPGALFESLGSQNGITFDGADFLVDAVSGFNDNLPAPVTYYATIFG